MIRLRPRPAPPATLEKKKTEWTNRWKQRRSRAVADWATKRAKQTLDKALNEWSYGKCAYCESRPAATGYMEIEHFIPKSGNEELVFEWTNLLPGCRRCNGAKGERDPTGWLIRPDSDNPEEYLWVNQATGELGPADGLNPEMTTMVDQTIEGLDLNRGDLKNNRKKLFTVMQRWFLLAASESGTLSAELREELDEFLEPRTEYKLVARQTFNQAGSPELVEEDRRRYDTG